MIRCLYNRFILFSTISYSYLVVLYLLLHGNEDPGAARDLKTVHYFLKSIVTCIIHGLFTFPHSFHPFIFLFPFFLYLPLLLSFPSSCISSFLSSISIFRSPFLSSSLVSFVSLLPSLPFSFLSLSPFLPPSLSYLINTQLSIILCPYVQLMEYTIIFAREIFKTTAIILLNSRVTV